MWRYIWVVNLWVTERHYRVGAWSPAASQVLGDWRRPAQRPAWLLLCTLRLADGAQTSRREGERQTDRHVGPLQRSCLHGAEKVSLVPRHEVPFAWCVWEGYRLTMHFSENAVQVFSLVVIMLFNIIFKFLMEVAFLTHCGILRKWQVRYSMALFLSFLGITVYWI